VTVHGEEKYVRDELQEIYDWWHGKVHGEYPALEDAIVEQMQNHKPVSLFNEIEGEPNLVKLEMEYASEEDQRIDIEGRCRLNVLEERVERETREMMHRLVDCYRWLWT
jgi:hypothetical protein